MSSLNIVVAGRDKVEMRPGHAVVGHGETMAQYEPYDKTRKFLRQPGRIHLISLLATVADAEFLEALERQRYRYDTDQNRLFHLRLLEWASMKWALASVPAADQKFVEGFAQLRGRYLDREAVVHRSEERFPFRGDQFFFVRHSTGRTLAVG